MQPERSDATGPSVRRLLLSAMLIICLALGNLHPASLAHDHESQSGQDAPAQIALPDLDDHDRPDQGEVGDHHIVAVAQRTAGGMPLPPIGRDSHALPRRDAPLTAWRGLPMTEPPSA